MLGWFYFTLPSEEEIAEQRRQRFIQDSSATMEQSEIDKNYIPEVDKSLLRSETQGQERTSKIKPATTGMFAVGQDRVQSEFVIETPRYRAVFTNLGAGPSTFTLKDHETWNGQLIQMIGDTTRSAYNAGFLTTENYNVDTNTLLFQQITLGSSLSLEDEEIKELSYSLNLSDGRQLIYTYTFYGGKYEIDLDIRFIGIREYVIGRTIDFGWSAPLRFTEKDPIQEALATTSYLYSGGELEQLKVTDYVENDGTKEQNVNGKVDWVATKTKFFFPDH